jgi:glutathione synthase
MNILFLMDPLETVVKEKDTTFALMCVASQKGHQVYYLPKGGMSRVNGQTSFHVFKVVPDDTLTPPFSVLEEAALNEALVDIIFIRQDPPFDDDYLNHTWLLDLLPERITILNNPTGIRTANEKIWASQFLSVIPPTLIGRRQDDIYHFMTEQERIIVKPTNGFGGQSVFYIDAATKNNHVILETVTKRWTCDVVCQKFVPEAVQGDKRILLLNGEPLGAVLRVHAESDHRNNFFSGGKAFAATLSVKDKEIIATIKPFLRQLGLYFVGIDVIGEFLIEINVTSPTCLQEMSRFDAKNLADDVIAFSEQLHNKKGD